MTYLKTHLLWLVALLALATSSCNRCADMECVNGDCEKGDCLCDEGWQGPNCDEQTLPDYISINAIRVVEWPETWGGGTWDPAPGRNPDFFLEIFKNIEPHACYTSERHNDAEPGTQLAFTETLPLKIDNPYERVHLYLYEFDSPSDPNPVVKWTFPVYRSNNGFPTVLQLNEVAGFKLELDVSYTWR